MGYSRFFLSDLQVHTPADAHQGYGAVGGREPNAAFAERLVAAHAESGVEVIAVSDHNRVDWYPVLREAGEKVGVYVFPALEFSVNRCHLLAIWDRTDQGHRLAEQFLTTLWKPGEDRFEKNGDPRPVGQGQVHDLAVRAAEHQALILAPHATMADLGFLARGVCTNRKDVIKSGCMAGYDVYGNRAADVLVNPAAEFGDLTPSWFISGDVRRFDDVGKRAVYLKLGAEPTLEGIRQAFLIPETRIRFPEPLSKEWGKVAGARFIESVHPTWPRIDAITIKGGFHDKLAVGFAPGLNAIIGGKGTGKSTLIEILRHTLHAGDAYELEAKGNREHNFRVNAEAVIAFTDEAGDCYRVERTGGQDRARLLRDGKELAVEVPKRVAVRVFGQRELQALTKRPEVLREFVATESGTDWTDAQAEERKLVGSLRSAGTDLKAIEDQLASLADDEQELADLVDRISNANAHGAGNLIERLSALGTADDSVKAAFGWPAKVGVAATTLRGTLPAPEVSDTPRQHEAIRGALRALEAAVEEAASSVDAAVSAAGSALEQPAADWTTQSTDERDEIERALADAGLTDPRELGRLQTRARELQTRLADLPTKRDKAADLNKARESALRKLGELRRHKSRLVEAAAQSLNGRIGQRVRITVDPLSDTSPLLHALEASVKGQGVKSDQLRRLAETHSPATVAAAIREGQAKVESLNCTATTASKLCAVDAATVRTVEEVDTPDRIVVEVDLGDPDGTEAWHDVQDVSPGQRATALLALALAGGREPLIIDQPEDDLDNRYIYDEVVRVLADVCQNRQVIVATHNANIPILGDAELVLALDAQAAKGSVLACGGLEDPSVAQWARKILEGGEEAFQARHRRYQAARA